MGKKLTDREINFCLKHVWFVTSQDKGGLGVGILQNKSMSSSSLLQLHDVKDIGKGVWVYPKRKF